MTPDEQRERGAADQRAYLQRMRDGVAAGDPVAIARKARLAENERKRRFRLKERAASGDPVAIAHMEKSRSADHLAKRRMSAAKREQKARSGDPEALEAKRRMRDRKTELQRQRRSQALKVRKVLLVKPKRIEQAENLHRQLMQVPLYVQVDRAVPRTWPKHIRDDIIGAVILGVLENPEATVTALVKQESTAYWRGRPEYRMRSMDAPIADGARQSLHELIAAPEPEENEDELTYQE